MRLPHDILDSLAFTADCPEEVIASLGDKCTEQEAAEIVRLYEAKLPPVTTGNSLAVMTGFNPGFIWSLIKSPSRHYRVFEIPKGKFTRQIEAPRIGLKIIQKWLSLHFERKWQPHDSVHGFVRGRSHISAARVHVGSEWVITVDIVNFFPSTPASEVLTALTAIGYKTEESLQSLLGLCCFRDRLAQGAPTSPVLSNIALDPIDRAIFEVAKKHSAKFTRYADDIVFSGVGRPPEALFSDLDKTFLNTAWRLSEKKRSIAQLPGRLKVHGLLVDGENIRLTKGYRNQIRAYKHLFTEGKIVEKDVARIFGHITYASQIR